MSFNVHLDQINPLLGQETVEIDGWYNKVWNSHAEVHGAIGTRSLERQFTHAARHGHLMDKNVFQMIELPISSTFVGFGSKRRTRPSGPTSLAPRQVSYPRLPPRS